jgi:hypothetical protein
MHVCSNARPYARNAPADKEPIALFYCDGSNTVVILMAFLAP